MNNKFVNGISRLKNKSQDYYKLKKEYICERENFNISVCNMIESDYPLYFNEKNENHFKNAIEFFNNWNFIFESIDSKKIEELSKKYIDNSEMIKTIVVSSILKTVTECKEIDDEIEFDYNDAVKLYDYYILYRACGYDQLIDKFNKIKEFENEFIDSKDEFVHCAIDSMSKLGSEISNKSDIYGELAKEKTKVLINKGSKKLINILSTIEEKTK